jgi:hypothetical protein
MTSLLNFFKLPVDSKLLERGKHRQLGDVINLTFLFKEIRLV